MTANLRMGIVGLGMMGRHHARILASLKDVHFVGAVDPNGDPEGVLLRGEVYSDLDQMLRTGVDAVVEATVRAAVEMAQQDEAVMGERS